MTVAVAVAAGGGVDAVVAADDGGVVDAMDDGSTLAGFSTRTAGFVKVAWGVKFYPCSRSGAPNLQNLQITSTIQQPSCKTMLTHPHRLTRLRLWLPLPRLNPLLLHRHRPIDVVQLEVQSARIAHRLTRIVPPPQGRAGRLAVGAHHTRPSVAGGL
jgi:hypothetical protein